MSPKRQPKKTAAGKKTAAKKPRNQPAAPPARPAGQLGKSLAALALLIGLVLAAAAAARLLLPLPDRLPKAMRYAGSAQQPPVQEPIRHKKAAIPKKIAAHPPKFEVFTTDSAKTVPRKTQQPATGRPQIALIIDDLGYDYHIAEQFLGLDATLTFAVLPFSPYQTRIAQSARSHGFEIMLHLPMEPVEYPRIDPGLGALLTDMTPDELIGQLRANIDSLPMAVGVNNHMGSRLTAASDRMKQVFTILKKRNLYFIDSRTTAQTQCENSARLLQVPFSHRDVFLDHQASPDAIRQQIKRLLAIAAQNGHAVGIGHPYAITVDTLRDMLPLIKQQVELVPASAIVS